MINATDCTQMALTVGPNEDEPWRYNLMREGVKRNVRLCVNVWWNNTYKERARERGGGGEEEGEEEWKEVAKDVAKWVCSACAWVPPGVVADYEEWKTQFQ